MIFISKHKRYKLSTLKIDEVHHLELSSQDLFNSDLKTSENIASSKSLLIIQCTSGGRNELMSFRPPLLNSFAYDKSPSIC